MQILHIHIDKTKYHVSQDHNCIDSYTWQCIPITDENCPRDEALEKVVMEYKNCLDLTLEEIEKNKWPGMKMLYFIIYIRWGLPARRSRMITENRYTG